MLRSGKDGSRSVGALLTVVSLTFGMGCSYRIEKGGPSTLQTQPSVGQSTIPGYNTLRATVFQPHCIACHGQSGGVNLETYASAFAAMDRIENEAVTERSMPPTGELDASDQALVNAWVNAGGPENDIVTEATPTPSPEPSAIPSPSPSPSPSASPSTTPSGSPSPVASVTYATVRDAIFTPQCIRCHSSSLSHPSGGVKLDTYASVKTYLSRVENEILVDQSMPPSGPLSSQNQALFSAWVQAGTPQ